MSALAKALRLLSDEDLAGVVLELRAAPLAAFLRGLSDQALLDICIAGAAAPTPRAPAPPRSMPKTVKPEPSAGLDVRTGEGTEKVLAVLRAADGELPPSEIAKKAGVSENSCRRSLSTLRGRGLAQHNGQHARGSRWSLAL